MNVCRGQWVNTAGALNYSYRYDEAINKDMACRPARNMPNLLSVPLIHWSAIRSSGGSAQ